MSGTEANGGAAVGGGGQAKKKDPTKTLSAVTALSSLVALVMFVAGFPRYAAAIPLSVACIAITASLWWSRGYAAAKEELETKPVEGE